MTVRHGDAPLSHVNNETVPYSISEPTDTEKFQGYVLWEKGYGNGHIDKIPLQHAFAKHGYGIVVTGQNRKGMLRDPQTGEYDAVKTLAHSSLAAVEALGLVDKKLHSVGYSAGGLVVASMIQEADVRDWTYFKDATTVLAASSGVLQNENPLKLTARGLHELVCMSDTSDIPVLELAETLPTGNSLVAVARNMLLNFPRAVREYGEISTRNVRLAQLAQRVRWLSIAVYGDDLLAPARKVDPVIHDLFIRHAPMNVSYFTPYSNELAKDGMPVGVRGANHMDPFTYPQRIVDAVVQQFRNA